MSHQLSSLLEKLGLKFEDLTDEERKVYDSWNTILAQPDITIEDLKRFIPLQIELLELDQDDYKNSQQKDLFLKATLRNLKMIHAFILGPQKRKEWLDHYIENKIKQ